MARRQSYVRDASGRFASTPGGGGKGAKRGRTELVRARRSVRQAKRKLAGFDPADQSNKSVLSRRAQRGAVTKAQKRLAAVKKTAVIKGARVTGTIAKKRRQRPAPAPAPTPAKAAAPKRSRGGKVRMPRMATPAGAIRKSDLAKVKADAKTGIGTPMSRAARRAFARSAREAPLVRKQAIAAAKRKGVTGFGKGPQMNTRSIGNSAFNWNRNEQPATARERLEMWQKSERRNRGFWSGGRGVAGAYAGELRASRRAAALVDSGDRRGNLPTTRKMAEQPRQRRVDRVSRNETQGRLAASDANRRLLPQIQKVRDAAQKRITEGKKPTAAQREKERKLVGEYNKQARKLQVAQAAKAYMENPWGFTPQRMSGSRRSAGVTEPAKPRPARSAGEGGKRKRKAS